MKRNIPPESRKKMGGHTRFKPIHGMKNTPEYRAWYDMRQRCINPKVRSYKHYGGRGVSVCSEWMDSFEAFYEHIGPRPEGFSLDRIDTDKNYEPGNVRWSSPEEQQNNKRTTVTVVYQGEEIPVTKLARRFGMKPDTLRKRIHRGVPVEEALK